MPSFEYTDIQAGVFFRMDGTPYETIESTFSKKSRQKGSNQVRIKNLLTGAVITKTLHTSDKPEKIALEKEAYTFIYARNNEATLHPKNKPSERITIPAETVQNIDLVPSGTVVTALQENETIVTLQLPIKVDLTVKEAPPSIRGNTAQGGTKKVTVETGASITVPLFIETGDRIRINTVTREYVERVTKK